MLQNITDYLINNNLVTTSKANLLAKIKTSYNEEFAYMKNVCKKILIKDYILEAGETVSDITKENYFGFVYMPKKAVTLKSTSFMFVVDDEQEVNLKLGYTNGVDDVSLEEAVADSSWFVNGMMDKALECTKTNEYIMNPFTAIDTNDLNYLAEEKTLFQILRDNKFETYFKNTNGDYSEETLLKNVNTGNYIYMQMSAEAPYNFAEAFAEVKEF